MNPQKRFMLVVALASLALALFALGAPGRTEAGSDSPQDVVENLIDEINAGSAAGAAFLVSPDFILTDIDGGSFMVVGKPAFRSILEEVAADNLELTISEIEADGQTVTGVIENRDDVTDAAGIDRYLQPFTAQVTAGGLISRIDLTYDTDDAETQQYLEYVTAQDEGEGGGEEPPGLVTVALGPQPGGSQPGEAFLFSEEQDITLVGLEITAGPAGVQQPAHFHTGTCAAPGPIVEPLANVLDGGSFTILSADMDELVDAGLIINVHKSTTELTTYVSCGQVLSAAAPAPTPATPAPTPGTGVLAPDTGTGATSRTPVAPFWLYALLAAGMAAITVAAARRYGWGTRR